MNCIKKPPAYIMATGGSIARNWAVDDVKAQIGIVAIPINRAIIIALRRPDRSDKKPKNIPPAIAPTIVKAVNSEAWESLYFHCSLRNVGYRSWVPCETRPIMVINRAIYRKLFQ